MRRNIRNSLRLLIVITLLIQTFTPSFGLIEAKPKKDSATTSGANKDTARDLPLGLTKKKPSPESGDSTLPDGGDDSSTNDRVPPGRAKKDESAEPSPEEPPLDEPIYQYYLSLGAFGEGAIRVTPSGPYDAGTVVTLTAKNADGWSFAGWSGDMSGSSNPVTITMDKDQAVTATFTQETPAEEPTVEEALDNNTAVDQSSGDFEVLRFESQHTFGEDKDNSDIIAPLVDIYDCSFYYSAVIPGVHETGGEVIAYRNFLSIWDGGSSFQEAVVHGYALMDADGNYVYEQSHPENKVMDPGSQLYRQKVLDCVLEQQAVGYDGVFADNAGIVYPQTRWIMSARPINPRTGLFYTDEEWLLDMMGLVEYVKQGAPDMKIVTNGLLYSGYAFYKPEDRTIYEYFVKNAAHDGMMVEGVFNNMGEFYSEADWVKSVELIEWLQDNLLQDPKKILVLWSQTSYGVPAWVTKDQASAFIFASSLMGVYKSGQNYIACHGNMDSSITQSLYQIPLGSPVEPFHMVSGTHVYEREFTKSLALVNPTLETYTVQLEGTYTDLGGSALSEVTLGPLEGTVLSKTG